MSMDFLTPTNSNFFYCRPRTLKLQTALQENEMLQMQLTSVKVTQFMLFFTSYQVKSYQVRAILGFRKVLICYCSIIVGY